MGAPRQPSCTRAHQGIPSSQSWKTRRTSSSHLYCCIVGLMVMDCFLCFFDIHVRLYSWLHKCNSCDIAILLFQSFLCSLFFMYGCTVGCASATAATSPFFIVYGPARRTSP